ncbi:hypothetical protein ID0623_14320 [Helicobacter pylori]
MPFSLRQSFLKFDNQRPLKNRAKNSVQQMQARKKLLKICLEKTNANAKESFKKLVIKVKRKTILKRKG